MCVCVCVCVCVCADEVMQPRQTQSASRTIFGGHIDDIIFCLQ